MAPMGTFSWHELATSDNEAAFAFYSGLFGWDAISRMDMGPMGTYLILARTACSAAASTTSRPTCPHRRTGCPMSACRTPMRDSRRRGEWRAADDGADGVPGGSRIAVIHRSDRCRVRDTFAASERRRPQRPRRRPNRRSKRRSKAERQTQSEAQEPGKAKKKKTAKKPAAKKKVVKKAAPKKKVAAKKKRPKEGGEEKARRRVSRKAKR